MFLDANVLYTAAHNPDGLSRLLFELHRLEVLTLIGSSLAVAEARANLSLKAPKRAANLAPLLARLELVDTPVAGVSLADLPQDDQLIFAAAVAGRATHLLTGDKKHFGPHFDDPARTNGVRIQTVRAFFTERFGL